MQILTFNTGREYTKNGQRIAAARVDGGVVFVDIDRGIDGFIADAAGSARVALTQAVVMRRYDLNLYDCSSYRFPEVRRALELAANGEQQQQEVDDDRGAHISFYRGPGSGAGQC